nr:alpha/beta hydrolase [Roseibium hamelinense]
MLAACSTRPDAGVLAISADPAPGARPHDIMVVTTRQRDDRPDTYFNGERREQGVDFAEVTISVPPTHVPGQIEWPSKFPGDPNTDFVTRKAGYIDGEAAFKQRLNRRLAQLPKDKRTVFLFIHGYNTRFAEGLYRFAQFVDDSKFPGVPVFFTWASRGNLQDYVYDLNSAAIARDALEKTIRNLAQSNADEIVILAHSMGNWLLLETAARVSAADRRVINQRIQQVVLAAPDIDIDLFKAQLRRLGKPPKPYIVIVSKDDRALRLSRAIAGGKERVGAYSDDQELAELGAIVVDLTEVESEDSAHHSKFAQLAEFAPEIRSLLSQGQLGDLNPNKDDALTTASQDLGSLVASTAQTAVTLPVTIITAPFTLGAGAR